MQQKIIAVWMAVAISIFVFVPYLTGQAGLYDPQDPLRQKKESSTEAASDQLTTQHNQPNEDAPTGVPENKGDFQPKENPSQKLSIPQALLALYNSRMGGYGESFVRTPLKKLPVRVLGYSAVDYKGDFRSYQSISKYSQAMDAVSTFSYQVTEDGRLLGQAPVQEIRLIRSKGVRAFALIHNFTKSSFDRELASTLLESSKARRELIQNLLKEMDSHSYNGVNVDIENIPFKNRGNYSQFLRELKEALAPRGYLLVASIPAKTYDDPESAWSGGFDYLSIGRYADLVQLMTYDEHWFGGAPGPIASIGWVEQVIQYALQGIPAEKILIGIASYGYNWAENGKCTALNTNQIYQLADSKQDEIQWDSASQSPYYQYTDSDQTKHVIWFENAESVGHKLDLVNRYHLGGVALWRLGFEEPALWKTIQEKLLDPASK